MKLRCLLIDDEPPALKVLANYAASINGLEVVGQCRNALEALDVLQQKKVDVMFLDIKMPSILGTDFLKNLAHPPKVIFVTAYREYAIEGFELDAIDYLVKPVSFDRFFKAVTKVHRLMGLSFSAPPASAETDAGAFVYLKVDREMKKILINEITFIESCKDYVKVFMGNGRHYLVKQSISSMENLLSEHKFLRIHRSYIVSIKKIEAYNHLTVSISDKQLPIGRLYKQNVIENLL